MSSAQGRWSSPDLINLTDDRVRNPANTLNKYIYGGNNPLKYVDPDGRDITILYESGYPTGHVMLAAVNQQTGDSALLSVGPQTHFDPGIPLHPFSGVPGTTDFGLSNIQSADDLRSHFAALTIQTTPEVAQQAIEAIRNGAGFGNWALLGNNCTSSCAKVLQDIGLSPGSRFGTPWTPSKFWANLNLLYGKNVQPSWYRSMLANTLGGSDLFTRPATPGTDYGNPRPGINNTFDYLFMMFRQQCSETWDPKTNTLNCGN